MTGPIVPALVVARAENDVIGKDGQLPWRISADLKFFKATTVGKPVIMGRKTYDSIGKPLPRRTNIVVTRNAEWRAEGVVVAPDLPTALALAYVDAHRTGVDEVMIIGGAEIYAQSMASARRIYLTEVHRAYDGDARFTFDKNGWREVSRQRNAAETEGGPEFSFVVMEL